MTIDETNQLTDQQRRSAIGVCLDRFVDDYGWRFVFECLARVAETRCSRTAFEAASKAAAIFAKHEQRPEGIIPPRPSCVRFARFK